MPTAAAAARRRGARRSVSWICSGRWPATGFSGRLRDVQVGSRNESGRVARLDLSGLSPAQISASASPARSAARWVGSIFRAPRSI
jgi:hypothetical protein